MSKITIAFYGKNITQEKIDQAFSDQQKGFPKFRWHNRWSWRVIAPGQAPVKGYEALVTRDLERPYCGNGETFGDTK